MLVWLCAERAVPKWSPDVSLPGLQASLVPEVTPRARDLGRIGNRPDDLALVISVVLGVLYVILELCALKVP